MKTFKKNRGTSRLSPYYSQEKPGNVPSVPVLFHEWADPNVNIAGWSRPGPVSGAAPNDVIAQEHGSWGHAGIVVRSMDGSLATVSVNSTTNPAGMVTRNNWGFRPGGNGEGPGDPAPVVRRYVGDLIP